MHLSRFVSANLCSTSICKVRTVLSRIVKCDKMFIVRIKKKINYILESILSVKRPVKENKSQCGFFQCWS